MKVLFDFNFYFQSWIHGDQKSFKILFDYLMPKFMALAFNVTRSKETAEEITMNTFLQIWQMRDRYTHVEAPDHYFFGILRQQIAAYLRKKKIHTEELMEVHYRDVSDHDNVISVKEVKECYQVALDTLTEQQRKVFQMSREQYLTNKEIAEILNISVHTVNNHIKAAIKVMKAHFYNYPDIAMCLAIFYMLGSLL
ncbi:sigma-70 family RNA polymerase sigma factor [Sphingobacterium faecale]|uniref:Sigma-70 family RNA polymerase sigma factor n=1 Tax=Sphingobacterium faecale TaxID=2803775 RepID=A0ABS1R0U1_9SPHI|nr:sigma-70 family RNA polymerase sigma factor [Sphingobacterium faecale]MBL1407662.1 sigma-70 family RNA polymerase sigma factor [Sphingobacterium faecale]